MRLTECDPEWLANELIMTRTALVLVLAVFLLLVFL